MGEIVENLEQLFDVEIEYGLGKSNGSNNKSLGFNKKSEFYSHIGSCRTTERILRFLFFLQRIIENFVNDK